VRTPEDDDDLRKAYEEGRQAALRGEEAAPGCTVTARGRAFLEGYVAGAAERPVSGGPSGGQAR
jgi:hypothetical protein